MRCVGEAGELTVGAVKGEVAGEHPVVPLVGWRGCGLRVVMVTVGGEVQGRIEEVEGGEVDEREEVQGVRVHGRCKGDKGAGLVQRGMRERWQGGEEPGERGVVEVEGGLIINERECQRIGTRYPWF